MKQFKLIVFTVISICLLGSCGGSKKAVPQSNIQTQTVVTDNVCIELAEQKPEVRQWGVATNFNMSSAVNYAELQARASFARAISSSITAAESSENIFRTMGSSDNINANSVTDAGTKQQEMQMSIAEGIVKNMVRIKTFRLRNQDGSYEVYVCLEYRGDVAQLADEIAKSVVKQRISDDDRLKMDYDFEKFRDRVKEELKNRKIEKNG